jgi:dihydroorotate dehydrogenase (NAD+) catalytic subunit
MLPKLEPLETHYIANVSGSTVEEYVEVCKIFDSSLVAAIELNISCPNVKKGGMEFGNDPEMSAQVVEKCRKATSKPLITKLSPNQADIQSNARLCIEAGTDALAVINTISGMAIDINKRELTLGNQAGGLSGPAIKPIALKKVYDVYQVSKKHGIPIIGQGGICSPEDVIEFILAGASTIGVGTALFFDPLICKKINAGVEEYLEQKNLGSFDQLVGGLAA